MEVIFKANDGTMFDSAEECVKYEGMLTNKPKEWEAWGWNGEPTNKTLRAVVVKLTTEDAAEQFLAAADLEGDNNIEGIEAGDEGWFFYDECAEQYFRIGAAIINIFKSIPTS